MNLAHLLRRQALRAPDSPAIHEGPRLAVTHAQWAEQAARLAAYFRAQGAQPGDRRDSGSGAEVRHATGIRQ